MMKEGANMMRGGANMLRGGANMMRVNETCLSSIRVIFVLSYK